MQNLREEYWNKIRDVAPENLISVDEAGSNPAMTRTHARSSRGTRARGSCPIRKGKNVSTITAITPDKILATVNVLGAANGINFEAFIIQKLVPKLWEGAVVTLDNCSIHLGKEIEEAILEKGAKLIYLPPYSPDFAPIENFWSKVKSILRKRQLRTYQELENSLAEAFSQVSTKDLRNWFTHCCYCTSSI